MPSTNPSFFTVLVSLFSPRSKPLYGRRKSAKHNRRRLLFGFRTSYTTTMCVLLTYYWSWAGPGSFLSGIVSGITGIFLYIGQWQLTFWRVLFSTFIGSLIGTFSGYLKNYTLLKFVVEILGLTYVNRCSAWDHAPKVYACLVILLGTAWPHIPIYECSPSALFVRLLLLIYVPFLITGFALLIPYPSFAISKVDASVSDIARSLSAILDTLLSGFNEIESRESDTVMYDRLKKGLDNDILELNKLLPFIEYEGILFSWMDVKGQVCKAFLLHAIDMMKEFEGIYDILHNIKNNKTHGLFVEALRPHLLEYFKSFEASLKQIHKYIRSIDHNYKPLQGRNSIIARLRLLIRKGTTKEKSSSMELSNVTTSTRSASDDVEKQTQNSSDNILPSSRENGYFNQYKFEFDANVKAMEIKWEEILACYAKIRKDYLASQNKKGAFRKNGNQTVIKPSDASKYGANGTNTLIGINPETGIRRSSMHSNANFMVNYYKEQAYSDENTSIRNLSPRTAYLHRVGQTVRALSKMREVFDIPSPSWTFKGFLHRNTVYGYNYIRDGLSDLRIFAQNMYIDGSALCQNIIKAPWNEFRMNSVKYNGAYWRQGLEIWAQPAKIALAITLGSMLVIATKATGLLLNFIWTPITMCWIRQDMTSSSFLIGYQRVEGTVAGAILAFTAYTILNCPNSSCEDPAYIVPIISIWLGLCALFREGRDHGYSALVAGFTPIILLLGPTTSTMQAAWNRVLNTFMGVAILLAIDHLILPGRADSSIRRLVIAAINESSVIFAESVEAVRSLTDSVEKMTIEELSIKIRDSKSQPHDWVQNRQTTTFNISDFPIESPMFTSISKTTTRSSSSLSTLTIPSNRTSRVNDRITITPSSSTLNPIQEDAGPRSTVGQFTVKQLSKSDLASEGHIGQQLVYVPCVDASREHLENVLKNINALEKNLSQQDVYLALVGYEPSFWTGPFPTKSYTTLLTRFRCLLRSGRSIWTGVHALGDIFEAMMESNTDRLNTINNGENIVIREETNIVSYGSEDIDYQIRTFSYFNERLCVVLSTVATTLSYTEEAVRKLFNNSDYSMYIEPLLHLDTIFSCILKELDEYYVKEYDKIINCNNVDIRFIFAWKNVFESVCELVKNVSAVAHSLQDIHIMETLDS